MSKDTDVGTYTRTITTTPDTAQLLNYLLDTIVIPTLQKRVTQRSLGKGKKLSPEGELNRVLEFATGERR